MAEYVRRKRPPASHPHWARLHDLTHPPSVRRIYLCLGIGGVVSGAYCGAQDSITFRSALQQAAECSMYLSGFFAIGGFFTSVSDRRPTGTWPNIGMALLMAVLVFAGMFVFSFIVLAGLLSFRWLTGGLGWYQGAGIGVGLGLMLAAFFAWTERRNWRRRQRRWPRWDVASNARTPTPMMTPALIENPTYPQWTTPLEPVIQPEPLVSGNPSNVA